MSPADRQRFFALLAGVHAFYRQDLSEFAGSVWWQAMANYELAAVQDAFNRHCVSPDTGQFMPKPADLVRMLAGTSIDAAQTAWAVVDRAVRQVGPYASVTFDDPITMRVLQDMGGWIQFATKTDDEWPFVANEFRTRYKGYRSRGEIQEFPRALIGIAQAENACNGNAYTEWVLIGDQTKALAIHDGGHDRPRLGFTRLDDQALRVLPGPGPASELH